MTKEALASHVKARSAASLPFSSPLPQRITQVHRRFLQAFGPRHADTADILYNIGLLHKDLLDFETADKYMRSALDIYIKVTLLCHPRLRFFVTRIIACVVQAD